jgi:phosphoribosylanthranilate isomerase
MVKVKICGITNLEDALAAVKWGADALGFVFAPSPRQVTRQQVANIVAGLPPFVCKVGVFVDSELQEVEETMRACGLDLAQLHGSESPDLCQELFPRVIKSFRVEDESVLDLLPQYKVSAYLLDSYDVALKGGTGRSFDWGIAKKARQYGPIILSGGLTSANVRQAIVQVRPYAVDVSSGVESKPGVKDHAKLRAFLEVAKKT